ncbi:MAG: TSUP family transporter, partial [Alphaproteobacteria bacterium]|nr:TSUP family transporter [Alphaproteobacteria bacterium]
MNLVVLGLLFALVALFYASIGFGGGSSYLALLVLWGIPYAAIPAIALLCNIAVVSGNSFHYVRAGYLNLKLLLPLAAASVPFSYLGGRLEISKQTFLIVLFLCLL